MRRVRAPVAALAAGSDERLALLGEAGVLFREPGNTGAPGTLARLLVSRLAEGCRIDRENGDAVLAGDASLPCRMVLPLGRGGSIRLYRRATLDHASRLLVSELVARLELYLENERLREEAERTESAFRELLAAGGHEVRTPLAALKLQLQGLERQLHKEALDPASVETRLMKCCLQLDHVQEGLDRLLGAGLPDQPRAAPKEPVDLAQLAVEVSARMAPSLRLAGCALSVCIFARPVGAWDAEGLDRAVAALLDHARKHGPGRPIELSVSADRRRARLTIRESGPPLDAGELAELFSPFGHAAWQRHFGSTGLAVGRCKNELRGMGGGLTVESEAERTEYTIELPL